jgi:hypothetical protein
MSCGSLRIGSSSGRERTVSRLTSHVKRDRSEAKFWIDPLVELAGNWGFARHELARVRQLVVSHRDLILEAWHEHFD